MKLKTIFLALLLATIVSGQSLTPNLQLQIPAFQQTNWQVPINYDMTLIDTILGGVANLPTGTLPTVSQQANWITANTSSTLIANFIGGLPGQRLQLFCGSADVFTSLSTSSTISVSSPWSCGSSSRSITLVLLGTVWTEVARSGGSGGGGGGTPGGISGAIQFNNGFNFGGMAFLYKAADTSACNVACPGISLTGTDSSIFLEAADTFNGITIANQSGANGGSFIEIDSASQTQGLVTGLTSAISVGGNTPDTGTRFPGSTGPLGIANYSSYGDYAIDATTGQDIVGFWGIPILSRPSGTNLHWTVGFVSAPPISGAGGSPTEKTQNVYGFVALDQLGISTVDQAGVLLLPQTAPASGTHYAIEALASAGVSLLNDGIQLGLETAPANPPAGRITVYGNSTSGLLTCLTSTGSNCLPTTPGAPTGALQYNTGTSTFGGSAFIYNPADSSLFTCDVNPCATLTTAVNSGIGLLSSDGINNVTITAGPGSARGANIDIVSQSSSSATLFGLSSATYIGGTNSAGGPAFPGSTGPIAVANFSGAGDIVGDATTGQDLAGFFSEAFMQRPSGTNIHWDVGFVVAGPNNGVGGSATEHAQNIYGLVVENQLGLSTVDLAGVLLVAQTAPVSGTKYAIEALAGSGKSLLSDGMQLGPTVVASLPSASANPGQMMYVTDSTTIVTEGQTCVGSSGNKALAFSNGTVWKCF